MPLSAAKWMRQGSAHFRPFDTGLEIRDNQRGSSAPRPARRPSPVAARQTELTAAGRPSTVAYTNNSSTPLHMTDPLHRLLELFQQARRANDPCATFVTLATVDDDGMPVSRIITVREVTEIYLVASVCATSPKVSQLATDKWEVLCFWPSLMVQCRLRGHARIQHDEATVANWRVRPNASRLVDTYHARGRSQSSPIESRELLLAEVDALARAFGDPTECPETVATLLLRPTQMEIWLGSVEDRLHDRRAYSLTPTGWSEQVLVP